MRVVSLLPVLCTLLGLGCSSSTPPEPTAGAGTPASTRPQPDEARLLASWRAQGRSPVEYVVSKFESNRWVFLGEYHRIRPDVEVVAALVPELHRRTPVRRLALEFLCRDRTDVANRIVTAPAWDRRQAIDFFREQFPNWAYQEYLDIFEAVWRSNRERAGERGEFLLVGLHGCIDWEAINWGDDPEQRARELAKRDRYDAIMAEVLEQQLLEPGHPALVYTGVAHSTAKFPEYWVGTDRQLERMGNLVYREPWKDEMFFIALHSPFYDSGTQTDIYPFDGLLDGLMARHGRSIGFDVVGTPFASLRHAAPSPRSITSFSFGELYDGYIMHATPLTEIMGVTCIEDWVTSPEELRYVWRHTVNKEAAKEFSEKSVEEFRRDQCAPRPDHGVEFRRRFSRLAKPPDR